MAEKSTFRGIVEEHGSFIRRTLAQLGVAARDLADVEQEVLRGIDRGLPAFDPSLSSNPATAVRGWIFGICERQAANHRRGEIRRKNVLLTDDVPDVAQGGPTVEDELIGQERRALLMRLLACVEPQRRAVLIAYELEGIPMSDVAETLSIPVNTAWNRLRLGREDLRTAWKRIARQQKLSGMVPIPLGALFGHASWTAETGGSWLGWMVDRVRYAFKAAHVSGPTLAGGGTLVTAGVVAAALLTTPPQPAHVPPPVPAATALALASAPGTAEPPATAEPAAPAGDDASEAAPPADDEAPASGTTVAVAPELARSASVKLKSERIHEATSAMERGDLRAAGKALDSHARSHADGDLADEREVLQIKRLLAEGRRNAARDRARAFLATNPDSAFRAQVALLLGGAP